MYPLTRCGRRAAIIAFALISIGGCAWEGCVVSSEYFMSPGTTEALARATRLAPLDADLWRRLGISSLDTDPVAAKRYLERAAQLDPFDANALIGLGLLAEGSRNLDEAERDLVRAASLSKRFKPKWAVAYFYARSGRLDDFWPAAALAANIRSADIKPILQLAQSLQDNDPGDLAGLLKLDTQYGRAEYLRFLLSRPGSSGVSRIALGVRPNPETRDLLMAACERLIETRRGAEAVQLWNSIAGTNLSPHQGVSLTNARFENSGLRGFDWRSASNPGITATTRPEGLRLEFSGRQLEDFNVIEQFVPVLAARNYKLTLTYRTAELNGPTGLAWQVSPQGAPEITSLAIDNVPYGSSAVEFHTASSDILQVALRYRRPSGSMRLEGTVTLVSMDLKLQ